MALFGYLLPRATKHDAATAVTAVIDDVCSTAMQLIVMFVDNTFIIYSHSETVIFFSIL